jgi:ssDNA thymidine ADP-ribosyltransferase DarT-like protein
MIPEIRKEADERGITRLCHFTPSRNLVHIAAGKVGILATRNLKDEERSVFTPTDLRRLDNHEGYISCTIEYPNAWYFDRARASDVLFRDWVILLIRPDHLWARGTRFCPRNAASAGGRDIVEGHAGFATMFAHSVKGAHGHTYVRLPGHLSSCPTDEQAEVLVPDRIALTDIIGIVVSSETQAKNEQARLRLLQADEQHYAFIVAPALFDKHTLSRGIRSGKRPAEGPWSQGGTN